MFISAHAGRKKAPPLPLLHPTASPKQTAETSRPTCSPPPCWEPQGSPMFTPKTQKVATRVDSVVHDLLGR